MTRHNHKNEEENPKSESDDSDPENANAGASRASKEADESTEAIEAFELWPVTLEIGFSVAIPLVVLALAGRLLDKHFGTGPWLLLAGVFVSIPISCFMIWKKIRKYLQ